MVKPGLSRHNPSKCKTIKSSAGGEISLEQARSHWRALQGIGGNAARGVAEVVRTTGWIYSPGSTSPYLALRARLPECGREAVERAVFEEENPVEVYGPRACTMLVPAEDVPLALQCASRVYSLHSRKVSEVCKVTETEIRDLTSAITTVLQSGTQSAEMLRANLPKSLVRNLGEAGRKFGENSTAGFVLRKLQFDGVVQRIATDRRLDSGQYSYRISPHRTRGALPTDELCRELARRFFSWAAPSTLKEFAWWAGISQKDARVAVEECGFETIAVAGWSGEAWIPPDQLHSLRADRPDPGEGRFVLIPFRDNYLYFRRGIGAFLRPADRDITVLDWNRRPTRLCDLASLHHNAILLQDCLAGAWEFDPDANRIVWRTWSGLRPNLRKSLTRQIEGLEQFVRTELGDVAFYPFDTGSKRRERIASLQLQ